MRRRMKKRNRDLGHLRHGREEPEEIRYEQICLQHPSQSQPIPETRKWKSRMNGRGVQVRS
jgi:hypothetical protein